MNSNVRPTEKATTPTECASQPKKKKKNARHKMLLCRHNPNVYLSELYVIALQVFLPSKNLGYVG